MIIKNNIITDLNILSVKDLYKLKPFMEDSTLKVNKSQIARELEIDKVFYYSSSCFKGWGVIAAINEMRNRHSLSHPNDDLLQQREAEFVIRLIIDFTKEKR